MSLHGAAKGVEGLLHSLGSSLEVFSEPGALHRAMSNGKLSLLSLVGEFERTRDESYEKRRFSVTTTQSCLLEFNKQFNSISDILEKLVMKIEGMSLTFEKFHNSCDLEIDDQTAAERADLSVIEKCFHEMNFSNQKLRLSLQDFRTCAETCTQLTKSAISQLEDTYTLSFREVDNALTDFDRQRRRVQVKEQEYSKSLSQTGSNANPSTQFAEFSYIRESDALQAIGSKYLDSLRRAMDNTKFALEQSSMTGWASCNVFFGQLAHLFSELSVSGKHTAASLLGIKNSQKVSRELTEEKRKALQRPPAALHSDPSLHGVGALSNTSATTTPLPITVSYNLSHHATDAPARISASQSVNLDDLFQ